MDGIIKNGWVICPHCNKRQFPVTPSAFIRNMEWKCKACKKQFAVNTPISQPQRLKTVTE